MYVYLHIYTHIYIYISLYMYNTNDSRLTMSHVTTRVTSQHEHVPLWVMSSIHKSAIWVNHADDSCLCDVSDRWWVILRACNLMWLMLWCGSFCDVPHDSCHTPTASLCDVNHFVLLYVTHFVTRLVLWRDSICDVTHDSCRTPTGIPPSQRIYRAMKYNTLLYVSRLYDCHDS